jgi:hypothetical protein
MRFLSFPIPLYICRISSKSINYNLLFLINKLQSITLKLFAVGTTDDVIAIESLVDSKYGRSSSLRSPAKVIFYIHSNRSGSTTFKSVRLFWTKVKKRASTKSNSAVNQSSALFLFYFFEGCQFSPQSTNFVEHVTSFHAVSFFVCTLFSFTVRIAVTNMRELTTTRLTIIR